MTHEVRSLNRSTSCWMAALVLLGLALSPAAVAGDEDRYGAADVGPAVALVTGSTRGLGEEVARRLGAMGYHVIVHGRHVDRGESVVTAITEAGGSAEFRRADFLELDQVRELADGILADFDRLELLINNAGIGSAGEDMTRTIDGVEPVFQVNYLAHFLLTEKLLPLIRASAPARIINVSSAAQAPIDFDDVMLEQWEPQEGQIGRPYAQSKLAQVLHAYDLAERLEADDVSVNALHPATFMDTYMVRRAGIEPQATVGEGADAVMQLVTDEVGSGRYFRDGAPARAHEQAYDAEARRQLRELSLQLVGLED
jgi:NAD(P)-dependent dehydrogenase (short-subunit alcohol dehydrogenase family)